MTTLNAPLWNNYARHLVRHGWRVPERHIVISISNAVCELIEDLNEKIHLDDIIEHAPKAIGESGFIEWAALPRMTLRPDLRGFGLSITPAPDGSSMMEMVTMFPGQVLYNQIAFFGEEDGFPTTRLIGQFADEAQRGDYSDGPMSRNAAIGYAADHFGFVIRLLMITYAVLAAPGIRATESAARDGRLRPAQRETAPVIQHRAVDVNLDEFAANPPRACKAGNDGARRPLHHVRGHLRLVEKGLIPVRAHWRGDAAHGARLRDRNIKRDEEMQ